MQIFPKLISPTQSSGRLARQPETKRWFMSSFISKSYSFRVKAQAIWEENSSKCSRHQGFLITLSSPSNAHQCSNNSRKNSFARFMPFHFRYWKSYPQKIWNLTTNASNISRVPGTRHGFDIVPCFMLCMMISFPPTHY